MISTVTPPASEPMTASDDVLRQHLSVGFDATDDLISSYITAARRHVESYTRRRLITQTVRLTLDGFGCHGHEPTILPVAPIQSVDQVRYVDGAGAWQTLSADAYRLTRSRQPAELLPVYGTTWPVPRLDAAVVEIDLVVGYGDAGGDVEPELLQAMRLLIALWFGPGGREAAQRGALSELPHGVAAMLGPHRIWI